jgi:hypothetical protein
MYGGRADLSSNDADPRAGEWPKGASDGMLREQTNLT